MQHLVMIEEHIWIRERRKSTIILLEKNYLWKEISRTAPSLKPPHTFLLYSTEKGIMVDFFSGIPAGVTVYCSVFGTTFTSQKWSNSQGLE